MLLMEARYLKRSWLTGFRWQQSTIWIQPMQVTWRDVNTVIMYSGKPYCWVALADGRRILMLHADTMRISDCLSYSTMYLAGYAPKMDKNPFSLD